MSEIYENKYVFQTKWDVIRTPDGMFRAVEYTKHYDEKDGDWDIIELCASRDEQFLWNVIIDQRRRDIDNMLKDIAERFNPPIDENIYFRALRQNQYYFFEEQRKKIAFKKPHNITDKVKEIWDRRDENVLGKD